jgi:hypothetical protein
MKYPYALYDNSSILLTELVIPELPKELTFKGQKLFVKDEFHITLVSVRHLAEVINPNDSYRAAHQILQEFNKFIETNSLEEYEISSDLRFVQTDREKTIVVMANVSNLDKFFKHLNHKFSVKLPKQQAHVTLYRYPKDFIGIPIPSLEILESISKPIEIPELNRRFEKA